MGEGRASLGRTIPAGLTDVGFSSLATFLVGLFAARYLDPATLGAYALFFAAWPVAGVVATQLVFVPAEVAVLSYEPPARLGLFPQSLRVGLIPSLVAGVAVLSIGAVAPSSVPSEVVVPLAVTAAGTAAIWPIQDHIRRVLHLGGVSWMAGTVSAVQLGTVVGSLVILRVLDIPVAWIPFGALIVANLVSASAGIALAGKASSGAPTGELHPAALARSGRWLLVVGLLQPGAQLVASALVAWLAGTVALGHAEAARVVAQPLFVFSLGLLAVLQPRSMEAARRRRPARARRASRLFLMLVPAVALLYLAVVGIPWSGNPLIALLPSAYALQGLVAVTVAANAALGITLPLHFELIGGGRERSLASAEAVAAAIHAGLGMSAVAVGAFARPLSLLAGSMVRWVGYRRSLRRMYGEGVGEVR